MSGPGGDAAQYPWRFWLDGEPTVSAYRPGNRIVPRTPGKAGWGLTRPTPKGHETTVSDILDELHWRGLVAQTTDEPRCARHSPTGRSRSYCGFDPTAPSLHIGNLVQLLTAAPPAAGRAPGAVPGRRFHRADR